MIDIITAHIRPLLVTINASIASLTRGLEAMVTTIDAGADYAAIEIGLSQLDNTMYKLCNALAQIHSFGPRIADPIRDMVIIVDRPDMLVIRTPYLHRRKYPAKENHCVMSPLVVHALSQSPLKMRDLASGINVDILTVYPRDTSPLSMTDPDNISAKRIIDLATMALGIDDNGAITTLSIDAVRSDQLVPGTYTVIRPRASRNDDDHPIVSCIMESATYDYVK